MKVISVKNILKDPKRRSFTITKKDLASNENPTHESPQTRYECPVQKPCLNVGCRYNLFLDVRETGSITFNYLNSEPENMEHSCVLDIVDKNPDGLSLAEIGKIMNITRERVRQVVESVGEKVKDCLKFS